MSLKVRKQADTSIGSVENLDTDDKKDYIKNVYSFAKKHDLDYNAVKQEISDYVVELPEKVDLPDLSTMNKIYAIAQRFLTRVSDLEGEAISNFSRWQEVFIAIRSLLMEKEAELYTSEEIINLPNSKIQEAAVRKKLSKIHTNLEKVRGQTETAKRFIEVVKAKRQDLASVLTNLNRQVKTLSVERQKNY